MTDQIQFWQCGTCGRYITSERAILDHQSLFARLHKHDPEIGEHDGVQWRVHTMGAGDSLGFGFTWAKLVKIEADADEPLIVETGQSRRYHPGWTRMTHDGLADYLSGSSEATPAMLRAFAAALVLDEDFEAHPEVDYDKHVEDRWRHWQEREPERAMVELAKAQLYLGLMTFGGRRDG